MAVARANATTLTDLFHDHLNTLYGIEKESTATLTKMAHSATSPAVRKELEAAATETTTHRKRLDEVFTAIGIQPRARASGCTAGLLRDCEELTEIDADPNVRDAGLIAMAQAIQHDEIARYGTAHAWAQTLQQEQAGYLLEQSLGEERASSKRPTDLAQTVNTSAANYARA